MLQGEHSAIPSTFIKLPFVVNAGQKYCRMLQALSTFIKLPFVIKIFVLSIFEWPLQTSFTVLLIPFEFYCFENERKKEINKTVSMGESIQDLS